MDLRNNRRKSGGLTKSILHGSLALSTMAFMLTTLVAMSLFLSSCSSGRMVTLGQSNTGTISKADPSEGKTQSDRWSYHEYVLDAVAGQSYKFTLTSTTGVTTGIWSSDKGGWIVEVSPVVHTRTATYSFAKGGKQKLFIEVPATEVPAEYSWYVTR